MKHLSVRGLIVTSVAAIAAATMLLHGPSPVGAAASYPGAVRNLVAAAGGGTVILDWLPPLDDGGAPIVGYSYGIYVDGVLVYDAWPPRPIEDRVLVGEADFIVDWGLVTFSVSPVNEAGLFGPRAESAPVFVWSTGTPAPQVTIEEIAPSGGVATTDPDGTGPSATNLVTTTVAVPAAAAGGIVSIAETAISWKPPSETGFVLLGQEIVIESTVATDAGNPLSIVFRVDPSLVPVTIFRDGVPITEACQPPVTATPSPCIASGAGTAETTVLTDHASRWNVGRRPYAFGGILGPVDRPPTANVAKAGSTIPVRFSLGGDEGPSVFADGYPRSRQIPCDGSATDAVEETISGPTKELTYSAGTGLYEFAWKTERSWANTCRELIVRFVEDTEARAVFRLR